jgi:short-subunit dehydrogenase
MEGRNAIVTGASHGIGVYIGRALAARGTNLLLVARSEPELVRVAKELRGPETKVAIAAIDLAGRRAAEEVAAAALAELGTVDVLVNNAAVELQRRFHTLDADEIEAVLRVDLITPIELSRLLLPQMLERGYGRIVNISSIAGRNGFPFTEAYAASKDGLIAFGRVLRNDYRRAGISASAIVLGAVKETGIGQRTLDETGLRANTAFMVGPERVAKAVVRAIEEGQGRDRGHAWLRPVHEGAHGSLPGVRAGDEPDQRSREAHGDGRRPPRSGARRRGGAGVRVVGSGRSCPTRRPRHCGAPDGPLLGRVLAPLALRRAPVDGRVAECDMGTGADVGQTCRTFTHRQLHIRAPGGAWTRPPTFGAAATAAAAPLEAPIVIKRGASEAGSRVNHDSINGPQEIRLGVIDAARPPLQTHHHLRSRALSVPPVRSSASRSATSSSERVKSKICAFSSIRS